MLKPILTLFSTTLCLTALAQSKADKWYFGTNAYIDFTSGTPVAGTGPLSTSEGTSSVCDASGNLQFYTNGVDVWDRTNTIMSNGSGLMGDVSTTQTLIVPSPSSNSQYYIFTLAPDGTGGVRFSTVDMTLAAGFGNVTTTKNILLTDSTTEKIAAIGDYTGTGFWVVMHKWGNNSFYAYHLTSSGFATPVISNVGIVHNTSAIQNTYGQMKFNMCGNKLAVAVGYEDVVEVFDFDFLTGVISNPLSLPMSAHVYGVEFSKSSDFLYATSYDVSNKLVQFNISSGVLATVLASKTPLSVTDDLYALQYAPDGKIYVARSFGTNFLGVISLPEIAGSGCSYSDTGFDLDPTLCCGINGALGLPSFTQNFLKSGVTCPPLGIEEADKATVNPVFPSPSATEFNLDLTSAKSPAQVFVYDYSGKIIESFGNVKAILRFGKSYANGLYIVKVNVGGALQSYKVIRE